VADIFAVAAALNAEARGGFRETMERAMTGSASAGEMR